MLRSEEETCLELIEVCIANATARAVIGPREGADCRAFLLRLVEERKSLRETVIRQEETLIQLSRGHDALGLQKP